MLRDDLAGGVDPSPPEGIVGRQFDLRLQPELRLTTG
jgi:hypothetical protein